VGAREANVAYWPILLQKSGLKGMLSARWCFRDAPGPCFTPARNEATLSDELSPSHRSKMTHLDMYLILMAALCEHIPVSGKRK
jgi:hypothetical protein